MKKVVIIGAGGHGKVVADIINAAGDKVVGFLDDKDGAGALGRISDYTKYSDCLFIVAIGNAEIRERITKELDVNWYTAIHPSAVISPSAKIGEGTAIMANAVINACSVVGKHCIINTGAIVEHNNEIGDYAHISVGAKLGGTVRIGKSTWIGMGATIINNSSICDSCMIGAGAVVIKDIEVSGTYIGVPIRKV